MEKAEVKENFHHYQSGRVCDDSIRFNRVFSRIPLLEDKYLKTKEMHSLFALINVGTCDFTHQHGRHDVK